uniref:ankyrin repeat and SAM domain-containing protein 1A-like isoform X5 n=1 Tax=Myxine glutinosa TaxID=7769 RepID=UPI00358E577A
MGREQDLLEAARTGKVALVDKLLSGKRGPSAGKAVQPLSELLHSIWRGPNVNCVDCSGFTPLHHAALNGHKEIVLKLLQHEASPNIADEKGCFPLHLAAWKGDVEIVRVLIQLGPSHKINDQNQDDSCEIKRHGPFDPYVNAKNAKHETALHCAAEHGNTDVVSVLLEELADPTLRNSHFQTPLDLAACYGRIDVVGMLITAHPELMSSGGTVLQHTPLHLAARNGHKHVVQALLQAGMDVNMRSENGSALHEAALYGKEEVVRLLLQSGIDVNIKDKQSNKALDILKDHPSSKRIAQLLNVDFAEMREDTESDRAAVEPDNTYEELCSAISARIPPRNTLAKTPMKMHLMKKERPPPPSRPPPENSIDMDTQPDHWFPGVESARHMLIVTESENPYELLSAAETKVPHCHGLPKSADEFVLPVSSSDECINASSTPDYSPPSPATALHNIDSVIRPQIDRIMSSIGAGIRKDDVLVQKEEAVKKGVQSPAQTVGQWLESLGIQQYESQLVANGFDDINFLGNAMEDQDLLEIGILNSSHRQKLLQAARMLPKVRRIGYDGYHPSTVAEWLDSLELRDYLNTFTMNGYSSMEQVKKLWEIELVNVLKIALVGHRKRVLASFGDRYDSSQQKPTRLNQMEECCEPSLVLRPPNEATPSAPIQQWQHQPEHLIFSSCDYEAYYLGSMLVKDLRGTDSTHEACVKMRKSTEEMKKIPTITLSITYKGVKFIDSLNKNTIAEHEIRNISCAAQDPEDLCTFAYITKDLKTSYHYCHVFSAFDVSLAYEIILTLGQAFEVAYQLALQARQAKASGMAEGPDIKLGKPVPKPRTSIRKSTVDSGCVDVMTQPHGSVAWGSEPLQESKKITSTKYETTIF